MSGSMRIKRKLPPAPEPTRANFHKHPVIGDGKYIRVLPADYKPPAGLDLKPREKDAEREKELAKQREELLEKAREVHKAKAAEREKQIIDLYNDGLSNPQIAEIMGTSAKSISSKLCMLRRNGIIKEREMPDYEKTVIRLYNEGLYIRKIADAVNMTEGQVNTLLVKLRKHGKVGNRSLRTWTPAHDNELIRLWDKGYTQRDIAKMMGVKQSKIFGHAARLQREGRLGRRK